MSVSDGPVRHHLDRTFGPWRKSSFSLPNGECVEVALSTDAVALRDSKNPADAALVFHHAEWSAFLTAITVGEFDLRSL
ncbi:MAG: DUF397 domain-containing protein [Pseudonocardia sp.]